MSNARIKIVILTKRLEWLVTYTYDQQTRGVFFFNFNHGTHQHEGGCVESLLILSADDPTDGIKNIVVEFN